MKHKEIRVFFRPRGVVLPEMTDNEITLLSCKPALLLASFVDNVMVKFFERAFPA
jgi:hypothetical protein